VENAFGSERIGEKGGKGKEKTKKRLDRLEAKKKKGGGGHTWVLVNRRSLFWEKKDHLRSCFREKRIAQWRGRVLDCGGGKKKGRKLAQKKAGAFLGESFFSWRGGRRTPKRGKSVL